jgi:uncharacterized protein YraI
MRSFLSRMLLLVLLLTTGLIAHAQDATNISGQTLALIKVRGGAGTEYPVLTTIAFNTQVVIEARNPIGNWFLVHQDDLGVRGWVASRFVDWEETVTPLPNFAVSYEVLAGGEVVGTPAPTSPDATVAPVTGDATPLPTGTPALINISGTPARTLARVNLRNAADFNGGIITIVLYDVTVAVQARNARGNWLLVETPNGQRGWIAARYLVWETGEELASFPVSTEVITPDASITPIADAATVIPPSGGIATAGAPEQEGGISASVLVATLNIRAAPEATSRKLVQARMKDLVFIEARNARGDWLLIRTVGDVTYRGWVASRFIGWADDVTPLVNIPVSEEIIGDAP